MACGRAIIASDIPGTREQITSGSTGLLFPLDSEKHFLELVNKLDQQRDLARSLGENAHQWIVDKGYTWQAAKENYTALFHQHLSARA